MHFQAVQAILESPQSSQHRRNWSRSRIPSTASSNSAFPVLTRLPPVPRGQSEERRELANDPQGD